MIKSADGSESGYPRTTTSSHPNDNVIKTSAKSEDKQQKSRDADHDQGKTPSTDDYLKVLEVFEIRQSLDDSVSNNQLEHLKKRAFTSHGTTYG